MKAADSSLSQYGNQIHEKVCWIMVLRAGSAIAVWVSVLSVSGENLILNKAWEHSSREFTYFFSSSYLPTQDVHICTLPLASPWPFSFMYTILYGFWSVFQHDLALVMLIFADNIVSDCSSRQPCSGPDQASL